MADSRLEISTKEREKAIVATSFLGVAVNIILAGLKAVIGLMTNSIAIVLDAVNNLSDAMSSVITIVGTKLGAKKPNKKHPLGYGRIEYISSMMVSALIIYAGITSLVEAVKKIINPETPTYTVTSIVILLVAIVTKIVLGYFVKKQGAKYTSVALEASGTEAMLDAVLSGTVVISAIIYIKWGLSLEAYVGLVLAILIIKAGLEMMLVTLDDILGKRGDKDTVKRIKEIICKEPEVRGAYDLTMFNYGPNKEYASVHIELPDTMTVNKVDEISRRIQERVYSESGVTLTGISVYSHNTSNDEAAGIRDGIRDIIANYDWALQMHGFYLDVASQSIRFDLVVSFDGYQPEKMDILKEEINKKYPEYRLFIVPDIDV